MDEQKYVELMERMMQCVEGKKPENSEESSFRMKAGTLIAVVAVAAVLLGGWLGTIQIVQASHSEAIGSLKSAQEKTDAQFKQILEAVRRLEDIQMAKAGGR